MGFGVVGIDLLVGIVLLVGWMSFLFLVFVGGVSCFPSCLEALDSFGDVEILEML